MENNVEPQEEMESENAITDEEIAEANENYIEEETLLDVATGISFAPGENNIPIPLLDDIHCEELGFPSIWGGHARTCADNIRLSYSDHVLSEFRRSDRRAADPRHVLFAAKKCQLIQLRSNKTIMMRRAGQRTDLTASDVIQGNFINNEIENDNAFRFMAAITDTPAYWEKQKKRVLAMIRQFGLPNLFLTMSMAETQWCELLVILKKAVDKEEVTEEIAKEMTFQEKARLIKSDPITCSLYFDLRVKAIWRTFNAHDGPFGNRSFQYWFYRIEFQHRGSPHIHMIIKLNNLRPFDANDNTTMEEINQFLNETVSTDINHPQAYLQKHRCTFTCKRTVKGKVVCRFNAPFLPMDENIVLSPIPSDSAMTPEEKKRLDDIILRCKALLDTPSRYNGNFNEFLAEINCTKDEYIKAIRSSLKQAKVFVKREPNAARTNVYSPKIICLMRSNMDIQFITDAYAAVGYVVDYINKSNAGLSRLLRQALEESKANNVTVRQKLNKLSHVLYNSSEMSAQCGAWQRSRQAMSKASHDDIFINTNLPEVSNKN